MVLVNGTQINETKWKPQKKSYIDTNMYANVANIFLTEVQRQFSEVRIVFSTNGLRIFEHPSAKISQS